jgi:hypothetical protein
MIRPLALIACVCWLTAPLAARAATFDLEQDADGVTVKLDGKLFTRYVTKSGHKPILWPIIGPGGVEMTRGYPMRAVAPGEKADHLHHRSLWFTHGEVNGISFWDEGEKAGFIVHREFVKVEGGQRPVIVTRNDWMGRDGKRVCADERTISFGAEGDQAWIDMDVTLTASDGPVTFGDTKEGSCGVRVAGPLSVDSKQGGRIVNSEGLTDKEAWGKRAAWVDYQGPLGGQVVGIAILNHPKSFRYPTYWHVRTYGLFTANPCGVGDFTGGPKDAGDHTLQAGESFTLNYRFLVHPGNEQEAKIADAFARYAQVEK